MTGASLKVNRKIIKTGTAQGNLLLKRQEAIRPDETANSKICPERHFEEGPRYLAGRAVENAKLIE